MIQSVYFSKDLFWLKNVGNRHLMNRTPADRALILWGHKCEEKSQRWFEWTYCCNHTVVLIPGRDASMHLSYML